MERLKGAAALTEQDVGEFSHFKGKMMKISVHSYAVEDWGSLSLLESRGSLAAGCCRSMCWT